MSDYLTKAKRPGSDEWEQAEMRDNYYGLHRYGVQFSDGHVYPDGDCEIISEKPGETWEERLERKLPNTYYIGAEEVGGDFEKHSTFTREYFKDIVAFEIQSAVEAERKKKTVTFKTTVDVEGYVERGREEMLHIAESILKRWQSWIEANEYESDCDSCTRNAKQQLKQLDYIEKQLSIINPK